MGNVGSELSADQCADLLVEALDEDRAGLVAIAAKFDLERVGIDDLVAGRNLVVTGRPVTLPWSVADRQRAARSHTVDKGQRHGQ